MEPNDDDHSGTDRKSQAPARPQARLDFAQRLRDLRIERGFRTARSLAKALGIDENRYTRYERAEVEPDLELIRRICAVIGVTPNELLSFETVDRAKRPLSRGQGN